MTANQSSGGSPWSSTPNAAPGASPAAPVVAGPQRGRLRSRLSGQRGGQRGGQGGGQRGAADGNVQTFRSPTAMVIWILWLLFAVANWIDLAVQGRDHTSVVAAAIMLLVTGIAYVTAQRPRIIADHDGVTVRNPMRDHRIGWASVAKVDLVDLLRVHCDLPPEAAGGRKRRQVISCWAVHYSRRRQLAAEVRSRRGPSSRRSSFGLSSGRGMGFGDMAPAPPTSASSAEADAELVVRVLSERATAAQAETVWATGTVDIAPPAAPAAPTSAATVPGAPTVPSDPTVPGAPTVPSDPTVPGAPTVPSDPTVPGAPTVPSDPTVPGTPTVSGAASAAAVSGWLEPLRSTWSRPAIAAVLLPALVLLIVCLV